MCKPYISLYLFILLMSTIAFNPHAVNCPIPLSTVLHAFYLDRAGFSPLNVMESSCQCASVLLFK